MNKEEMKDNWYLNAKTLENWGIPTDIFGKLVKLERGGYGKIAGLNPRKKLPFQITFNVNGQNRVISADLIAFKKMARCYL